MEIIVPAAGLSSRFPNTKPKYLLYDYDHKMMLVRALEQFLPPVDNIYIGILREHVEKFNAYEYVTNEIPSAKVMIFDQPTNGPATTVYEMLQHFKISPYANIFIKDCDSFFKMPPFFTTENVVCVSKVSENNTLHNLASKSFVRTNEQGIITDIMEKKVISDTFCVGGYHFAQAKTFLQHYLSILDSKNEIFVSHVISNSMLSGELFYENSVTDYVDVGTWGAWHKYNDMPVIFCDIDGTIIKAQGRYGPNNFNDPAIPLVENVARIKEYHDRGCMIIFTTARTVEYTEITNKMLFDLGFSKFMLIMGLHASKRILINDYNGANPYPRAEAINIRRDEDNLKDFL